MNGANHERAFEEVVEQMHRAGRGHRRRCRQEQREGGKQKGAEAESRKKGQCRCGERHQRDDKEIHIAVPPLLQTCAASYPPRCAGAINSGRRSGQPIRLTRDCPGRH
jgi:hypothetical protein